MASVHRARHPAVALGGGSMRSHLPGVWGSHIHARETRALGLGGVEGPSDACVGADAKEGFRATENAIGGAGLLQLAAYQGKATNGGLLATPLTAHSWPHTVFRHARPTPPPARARLRF
jgi:hypothetical protein